VDPQKEAEVAIPSFAKNSSSCVAARGSERKFFLKLEMTAAS
jgi:hypothetical protein